MSTALLPPWLRELVDMKAAADVAYTAWTKGTGPLEAYSAKMVPFVEMLRASSDRLLVMAMRDAIASAQANRSDPPPEARR